jgi:hypothetical protein
MGAKNKIGVAVEHADVDLDDFGSRLNAGLRQLAGILSAQRGRERVAERRHTKEKLQKKAVPEKGTLTERTNQSRCRSRLSTIRGSRSLNGG